MTATLAHIQTRYALLAICNVCAHTVELDVDGLIGTLGPDIPYQPSGSGCGAHVAAPIAVRCSWRFPIGSVKPADPAVA
jgi:hypothetical protein